MPGEKKLHRAPRTKRVKKIRTFGKRLRTVTYLKSGGGGEYMGVPGYRKNRHNSVGWKLQKRTFKKNRNMSSIQDSDCVTALQKKKQVQENGK